MEKAALGIQRDLGEDLKLMENPSVKVSCWAGSPPPSSREGLDSTSSDVATDLEEGSSDAQCRRPCCAQTTAPREQSTAEGLLTPSPDAPSLYCS